jgi:transglutaminase-like putative cysteine protease
VGVATPCTPSKKGLPTSTGLPESEHRMALSFTYRPGSVKAPQAGGAASAKPDGLQVVAQKLEATVFAASEAGPTLGAAHAGAELGAAEGWLMADGSGSRVSTDPQGATAQPLPFSCLDLLTAFAGEL